MKIAHISDLHMRHHLPGSADVPERLSRLMPDRFRQAIEQICAEAPDLLVLSGDLLDYPLHEMGRANATMLAQGESDLRLIAQILAEVACPIALVHGNHDHRELVQQVFAHVPNEQVVRPNLGAAAAQRAQTSPRGPENVGPTPEQASAAHRVFCFWDAEDDAHVPQRTGIERQHFNKALLDRSLPQIHVQHYVVWPERNEGYPHTYGDGAQLRRQIVESGTVKLVLSGHYHIGVPLFAEDGVYFCTVRGFTEAPHYYNIYQINGDHVTCDYRQLEAS